MIRLGILGSTRGTHLINMVEAIQQKRLAASIQLVISHKPAALIVKRAQEFGLTTNVVLSDSLTRDQYDQKISTLFQQCDIDLLVLIGYMRILSSGFIAQWENKIINVHPSLLPAFAGKMDLEVHRAVLDSRAQETGCTVHYVTEEVDAGPIILQRKCPVLMSDTAESLKYRVQQLESEALIEAIAKCGKM